MHKLCDTLHYIQSTLGRHEQFQATMPYSLFDREASDWMLADLNRMFGGGVDVVDMVVSDHVVLASGVPIGSTHSIVSMTKSVTFSRSDCTYPSTKSAAKQ